MCRYASEKVLKQEGVVMLLFTKLGNPECVKQTIAVAKSLVKLNGQVQMGEVNASDASAMLTGGSVQALELRITALASAAKAYISSKKWPSVGSSP